MSGLLALADAGAPDPAAKLLFGFDAPGHANWAAYSDTGSTATLGETSVDGNPCPGALAISVTYTAAGPKTQVYYNMTAQDWTGYKALHAWIKVTTSDYSTINGVSPRIDSNAYANKMWGGWVDGTTLADGQWHESVISLTAGSTYLPSNVNGFQYELQTKGTGAPPAATLLIDSIWLE